MNEVQRFVEAANSYISWIDDEHCLTELTEYDELWRLYKILSLLQAAAIDLNAVPVRDGLTDADDDWPESYEEIRQSRMRLQRLNRTYAITYNSRNLNDAPVHGVISGDLSEIYHDIRMYLKTYHEGRHADATFGWLLSFRNHWAKHANHVQQAIHDYLMLDENA